MPSSSPPPSSSMHQKQKQQQQQQQQQQQEEQRLHQLKKQQQQRHKIQQDLQRRIGEYASSYPLSISFPASVASSLSSIVSSTSDNDDTEEKEEKEEAGKKKEKTESGVKPLRTNPTLVQHRLLESGVFFDINTTTNNNDDDDHDENETAATTNLSFYQSMGDVSYALSSFVSDLNGTGCYDSVRVLITPDEEKQRQYYKQQAQSSQQQQHAQDVQHCKLKVLLKEKKWYNLYAGGGFKHDSSSLQDLSSSSTVPKVQFETRAGLLNLSGNTDTTSLSYTIDQTSCTTWSLIHDRPLYSVFSKQQEESILNALGSSKMNVQFRGVVDTDDFEFSRSYKELKRLMGVRVSNVKSAMGDGASGGGVYQYLDYTTTHRDILPRKHPTIPYCSAASPEIVSQSGQSYKHSLSYTYKMNNSACDDRFNPTQGYDVHYDVEVAGPPGDVGFIKGSGGMAIHIPLVSPPTTSSSRRNNNKSTSLVRYLLSDLSFHGILNCGYIRPITYGGLCPPVTNVADRFFVGGPLQLRGFLPAGIGPRAETGGPSTPGGDAMGGDFYYTATAATSIPFPGIPFLKNNGIRLMGFANAGTLTSLNGYYGNTIPLQSILKSTRVAVGGGITMGLGGIGRLEATYAVPVRYGPRDARKNAQFGLGFNIG